jgi:ABC-type multidrug transport system fused ATPase/permease subunit
LDRTEADRSQALADDVPFYGEGDPIPADRDLSAKNDTSGIIAVAQLLLRCWPYISPHVLGRWWVPGEGLEERTAELIRGRGYSLAYMPPLVTLLAVIGPYQGMVPATLEYPFNLFYGLVALTVACTWLFLHPSGRLQLAALITLLLSAVLANMVAIVLIEGATYSIYAGLITVACLLGWFVQVRTGPEGLGLRVRVGAHLIYYYGLQSLLGLGFMLMALLVAEVVNQSLLQNEPLMPGLAAAIGYPEMSSEAADTLNEAQRMELRWAPIKIEFALFLLLWPGELALLYYVIWIFQRIHHALRLALVDRWHRLSLRHHADHRVGDSIWRLQTDSEEVTGVLKVIGEVVMIAFSIVVALALLTILSPVLGSIVLFAAVPTLILARWAMPRFRTRSLVRRMANADLTSRVQESFRSIKLSKAYQTGPRYQAKFEEDSMIAFNADYRNTRLSLRVGAITRSYFELFILAGLLLMAFWVNGDSPTFATELIALAGLSFVVWNLSAFRWASERYEGAVNSLGWLLEMWAYAQEVAMGLKRVFDILDLEPEVYDREDAIPFQGFNREIRFEGVEFAYALERPVLAGVNLSATPGTITAIVGPTGAGKSTLMNLLLRLFDPDRGSITIDGHDLREFSVDSLRRNVAIGLQENVLFGMTIADNIRYAAPDATDERVQEAVRIACLEESVASLPEGLSTMLGDRGGRLSTGQRQRLSIARAVVRDAPILVLDEPTAALDAETEHRVLENLADWAKTSGTNGRAVFLITHRISTIRGADKIVYLDGGRVVASGDHDSLMRIEGGRYRAFVRAESGDRLDV